MINTNGIRSDGLLKQEIIDLFNDCDIRVYVEDQIIRYYNNKTWVGSYYLKTKNFYFDKYIFSKFFDNEIKDNEQLINELLRPIFEEIIKRKVSKVIKW